MKQMDKEFVFLFTKGHTFKSKSFTKFLIENFKYKFSDARDKTLDIMSGDELMAVYTGTDDDFNKIIMKIAQLGVNMRRITTPLKKD